MAEHQIPERVMAVGGDASASDVWSGAMYASKMAHSWPKFAPLPDQSAYEARKDR